MKKADIDFFCSDTKYIDTSHEERQRALAGVFNVNVCRGGWDRGCGAREPGRLCDVKVARIHQQLFASRFWRMAVCFPEAHAGVSSINYMGVKGRHLFPSSVPRQS